MDYKLKYLKYKKKYLNLKINGGNLAEGELWFYGSSVTKTKDNQCGDEFITGHLGISFDRKTDNDKKIYAFGPKRDFKKREKCVEGDIRDDALNFWKFYVLCSKKERPLFKLNIKYDVKKAEEFKKYVTEEKVFTYSDPIAGGEEFNEKFDNKYEFNNCITFIINIIDPIVDLGDGFKIINLFDKKLKQFIPGGWISKFIEQFGEKAQKLVYSKKK